MNRRTARNERTVLERHLEPMGGYDAVHYVRKAVRIFEIEPYEDDLEEAFEHLKSALDILEGKND